jgi:hypothetical protein
MTKLVVVLAVVVVVILVVVIVAVRNMRAEDPDEFDHPAGRGRTRGNQDGRDQRYGRRDSAGREPARAGRAARGAAGYRPALAGRGFDDRRDQDFDERGYDDRRSTPVPSGTEKRRRSDNGTHRPDEARTAARPRRRSSDSSEWDSSEWEKLSDVDYWAELASDKSLTMTAQPAAQRSAAPGKGDQARPVAGREPETLAVRGPVPGGAPRRDPVSGLPVRDPEQPADAGLPAAVGRPDFAPAPVPLSDAQERHSALPAADGDRGRPDRRRPRTSPNGDRARQDRQRLLDAPNGDLGGYLSAGPASLPLPAIRDVPPARQDRPRDVRPARQERPLAAADDDPLTSPSFPKIAADGRSYRNGRADTPPGGSRAPASQLAPTQQFAIYDSPAAQYPAPQHSAPYPAPYPAEQRSAAPWHHGNGGGDLDRTNPNAYRPGPLASQNPYPARASSLAPGPAPVPTIPASAGPAAASNPYGSYVTPDSQQTVASSYDGYPAAPGNGPPESYLPPAVPGGMGQAGNGYWHQQPSAPGAPDPGAARYPDSAAPAGSLPDGDAQEAEYRNGYGQREQAGYLPDGYPAGPHDPAGYAPVDPYGSDGYGGYPEYGAAGR